MRIGLITYYFPPENYAPAARMEPFVEAWSEEGDTVQVFTHRRMVAEEDGFEGTDNVRVQRTPFGKADNTRSLPERFFFELLFCISVIGVVLRRRVDVLIGTSPPFLVAATTLFVGKLTGIPYVIDVRDLFPEQLFAYDVVQRGSTFGCVLEWLEAQIYEHALLVVGVTKGLCAHIRDRTDSDVVVIRNGVDTRQFDCEPRAAPSDDPFVVLFHGSLARSQNVDLLLAYARRLKREEIEDAKLRVLGDGPKAEPLLEGIQAYGLEAFVEYLGHVDFKDVPDHLHRADVGFSPRKGGMVNETAFPVKIYECLACGLPVVVTPESEAGRYVEEHKVGFEHSNDDLEGIHQSIMHLKEEEELYREYSERAVRLADTFDRHALGRTLREETVDRL
jgi:glycosyltransferase involved in cell wall biosynthesis